MCIFHKWKAVQMRSDNIIYIVEMCTKCHKRRGDYYVLFKNMGQDDMDMLGGELRLIKNNDSKYYTLEVAD